MEARYTTEDVALLAQIRRDILARPDAYRDGKAYLLEHYGPEAVHRREVADWERFKDHPTEIAANGGKTPSRPKLEDCGPLRCVGEAVQLLLITDATNRGTHSDARAQAQLIMAVLVWTEEWNKEPYGSNPALNVFGTVYLGRGNVPASAAMYQGRYHLLLDGKLPQWMGAVDRAWAVMKPSAPGLSPAPPAWGQADKNKPTMDATDSALNAVRIIPDDFFRLSLTFGTGPSRDWPDTVWPTWLHTRNAAIKNHPERWAKFLEGYDGLPDDLHAEADWIIAKRERALNEYESMLPKGSPDSLASLIYDVRITRRITNPALEACGANRRDRFDSDGARNFCKWYFDRARALGVAPPALWPAEANGHGLRFDPDTIGS